MIYIHQMIYWKSSTTYLSSYECFNFFKFFFSFAIPFSIFWYIFGGKFIFISFHFPLQCNSLYFFVIIHNYNSFIHFHTYLHMLIDRPSPALLCIGKWFCDFRSRIWYTVDIRYEYELCVMNWMALVLLDNTINAISRRPPSDHPQNVIIRQNWGGRQTQTEKERERELHQTLKTFMLIHIHSLPPSPIRLNWITKIATTSQYQNGEQVKQRSEED